VTGYANAAARGRESAHETNTAFKLRTAVEYREHTIPGDRWGPECLVGELVGECGHVMERHAFPDRGMAKRVGKRRRCRSCPADPPKPLPADHCQYGIGGEFGERPCPTRARFIDQPGYGLLCGKHHSHLLRGGYLDVPCPAYRRPPGPPPMVKPPQAPAAPVLSPPRRGHLRLVTGND
jgi:hypothetical protein